MKRQVAPVVLPVAEPAVGGLGRDAAGLWWLRTVRGWGYRYTQLEALRGAEGDLHGQWTTWEALLTINPPFQIFHTGKDTTEWLPKDLGNIARPRVM